MENSVLKHVLVYDPIAFSGGSKKATINLLNLLPSNTGEEQQGVEKYTVVSANITDWQMFQKTQAKQGCYVRCIPLLELPFLADAEQGILYFIKHGFIAVQLMFWQIILGRFSLLLGTSGPGVDLALYLIKALLKTPIYQLVQGPVAISKTIAKCLLQAEKICYLASTKKSLQACLRNFAIQQASREQRAKALELIEQAYVFELKNGISQQEWPSPKVTSSSVKVLWAASILKWKGLDTLLDALALFTSEKRPETSICYIQPKSNQQPVTDVSRQLEQVIWHQQPKNLDEIRTQHSIFVSTSVQEPFGLSILEALAAGLLVVIPKDGAYWDQQLVDGEQCIKYQANNAVDLKCKLENLFASPTRLEKIALAGQQIANNYQAEQTYRTAVEQLLFMNYRAIVLEQDEKSESGGNTHVS